MDANASLTELLMGCSKKMMRASPGTRALIANVTKFSNYYYWGCGYYDYY